MILSDLAAMVGLDPTSLLAAFGDWSQLGSVIGPVMDTYKSIMALEGKRQDAAFAIHKKRIESGESECSPLIPNASGSVSPPQRPQPDADGQYVFATTECGPDGKPFFAVSRINPGDSVDFDKAQQDFLSAQEMARLFIVDLANSASAKAGSE